jgi:hypothetical protein
MRQKNNFQQRQLWLLPSTDDAVELPAGKRRELATALADFLLHFATALVGGQDRDQSAGGQDEHADARQDHA